MTQLPGLVGAGRLPVYRLTVTYTSGYSDTDTCDTLKELSKAIDAALAAPGFVRYEVDGYMPKDVTAGISVSRKGKAEKVIATHAQAKAIESALTRTTGS